MYKDEGLHKGGQVRLTGLITPIIPSKQASGEEQ